MKDSEIHYFLSGLKNLRELFQVVNEIKAETGMEPVEIRYRDGRCMKYNCKDAYLLAIGEISEEIYISKNLLMI